MKCDKHPAVEMELIFVPGVIGDYVLGCPMCEAVKKEEEKKRKQEEQSGSQAILSFGRGWMDCN